MKHVLNIATPIVIGILFGCWCADHHFGGNSDTNMHQGIVAIICGACVVWTIAAIHCWENS